MSKSPAIEDIKKSNAFEGNHAPVTRGMSKDQITIQRLQQTDDGVTVSWADGHVSEFHYIWLRHNCFCAQCGNSADGIRSLTIEKIAADVSAQHLTLDEDGDLQVSWSDGHHSVFGPAWLRAYCYSVRERARRSSFEPTLWKADIANHLPTVVYPEVRDDDETRLRMYELLRDYGIVHILEAGDAPAETEKLANLLGPIHQTSVYGYIFDLRGENIARAAGKTVMGQNPHTDDAFYYAAPGVAVFHCLVNSNNGGESVYVDGFAVAESLREEEPEAFELLTTMPIQHNRRHPGEIDMRSHAPLIRLDGNGKLSGIRYFDRAAAPLDVPADQMTRMYEALRHYVSRTLSPEFAVVRRLEPGSAIFVDNQRVMHARTAFDADSGRRIRLCVVDRDEFHARLRDLGSRFGRDDYDVVLPAGNTAS